ncbi:hypothetical protein J7J81_00955 [bacterium]|nr:hypothetical protein [bacterium]
MESESDASKKVKNITRNLWIDGRGYIHCIWHRLSKGGEIIEYENIFEDIDTAIRQHWHILWGYIGIGIREGKKVLQLKGESQDMVKVVGKIMEVSKVFLTRKLSRIDEERISVMLSQLLRKFERVRDEHKILFKKKLEGIRKNIRNGTESREKEQMAIEAAEAANNALKRFQKIAEIVKGVRYRLKELIREKNYSEKVFVVTYNFLARTLISWNEKEPAEKELRKFASELSTSKNALLNGLRNVVVQPYLQRKQKPQLQRLEKVADIVSKIVRGEKDLDYLKKVLQKAIEEMKPVVMEVEQRKPRYPRPP